MCILAKTNKPRIQHGQISQSKTVKRVGGEERGGWAYRRCVVAALSGETDARVGKLHQRCPLQVLAAVGSSGRRDLPLVRHDLAESPFLPSSRHRSHWITTSYTNMWRLQAEYEYQLCKWWLDGQLTKLEEISKSDSNVVNANSHNM
jgi:hypothetical protein